MIHSIITEAQRPKIWVGLCLSLLLLMSVFAEARLRTFFAANPFFNSLILGVLLIGILHALKEQRRLEQERRRLEAFKSGILRHPTFKGGSRLLGAIEVWFREKSGRGSLSTLAQKTLIESVSLRLDESRDLLRYLSGLSIFLGLLGTFWGLLLTIGSVTDIIGALKIEGDAISMFSELKDRIRVPLGGMATSFSTSLFGLSGSLVIGFLDLQTGQVQNHFLLDLEAWLMSKTEDSAPPPSLSTAALPSYLEALLEKTAESLERMERVLDLQQQRQSEGQALWLSLQREIQRFGDGVSKERGTLDGMKETLEAIQKGLQPLETLEREGIAFPEDLRSELRLMTRTLAIALEASSGNVR